MRHRRIQRARREKRKDGKTDEAIRAVDRGARLCSETARTIPDDADKLAFDIIEWNTTGITPT